MNMIKSNVKFQGLCLLQKLEGMKKNKDDLKQCYSTCTRNCYQNVDSLFIFN